MRWFVRRGSPESFPQGLKYAPSGGGASAGLLGRRSMSRLVCLHGIDQMFDGRYHNERILLPDNPIAKRGHDIEPLERGPLQPGLVQVVHVDADDRACRKRSLEMKKPPESGFPAPSEVNQIMPWRDCESVLSEVWSVVPRWAVCGRAVQCSLLLVPCHFDSIRHTDATQAAWATQGLVKSRRISNQRLFTWMGSSGVGSPLGSPAGAGRRFLARTLAGSEKTLRGWLFPSRTRSIGSSREGMANEPGMESSAGPLRFTGGRPIRRARQCFAFR
jgi:hypothetical protein